MSATARTGQERRVPLDPTPRWAVRAILPKLPAGSVLDPCAGDGSILGSLEEDRLSHGYEIAPARAKAARARGLRVECRDALSIEAWIPSDVILMKPSFVRAEEFVRRALAEADSATCVAALLQLNWLAGTKRVPLHNAHPADVFVLPRGPSSSGRAADAYGWFVWQRHGGGRWFVLGDGTESGS